VANAAHVRHDVPAGVAADLLALAATEPPWSDPKALPACLDALVERLGGEAEVNASLIYDLPHGVELAGPSIVSSGTDAGDRLLAALERDGMPAHLVDAGFLGLGDFWAPWCAVMDGEAIAALCFAARLTERGAAAGVYTFPDWRGRGFAAAATAAWSRHPDLARRMLGYSTLTTNLSSQRVAARLGLPRIGLGLRIT
jgi:hypothetical protein